MLESIAGAAGYAIKQRRHSNVCQPMLGGVAGHGAI